MLGACGLLVFLCCVLFTAILLIWPQHNVIIYPQYWYEPIVPCLCTYCFLSTIAGRLDCSMVLKKDVILSWMLFFKIFLSMFLGTVMTYIVIYFVWVHALGYSHPMPFIGTICITIGTLLKPISVWFTFPSTLRKKDKKFRKQLVAYLGAYPLFILMGTGYGKVSSVIIHMPKNLQFTLAFLFPLRWKN